MMCEFYFSECSVLFSLLAVVSIVLLWENWHAHAKNKENRCLFFIGFVLTNKKKKLVHGIQNTDYITNFYIMIILLRKNVSF